MGGGARASDRGRVCQGGFERRIDFFVKIPKKKSAGGSGWM